MGHISFKIPNISPNEIFHKEIFSEYSLFKTNETSSGVNHLGRFRFDSNMLQTSETIQ